ncbi:Aerobic-type carbon monoxide dehydrogenase, small subunit, CoxS/CutS family [Actinacidiphila yanglinensis]|uniref:Aerobic-type carbon monoxide dehydrogenase, small subunit, CoxS/CutS family n=1 Tax=Actinacidiphila yanglinensis TaxID=310779 RepID=A0A1H6D084_9ACTN|nr:(2Fe-2S)-binding protein [Actinacidiphila yanglinensis]SEG78702.1 Aerobic-type carbon monoxide dehydrogenase, small subunit, CoxS/CutS family [Actinacidiphila yanglinensis]
MTDQQPNERDPQDGRAPGTAGAWQPVPGGGDYDPDQTMHVSFAAQLPPEPLPGEDPLGAHGPAGTGWPGRPGEEGGYPAGLPLYGQGHGQDGAAAYDYGQHAPSGPSGGGDDGPGGRGGEQDPVTSWSIPVIREETEPESGEYSLGDFTPSWDQAPSPAPTQSFPAGMFGQGAAAAAQARAAAEAAAEQARTGADPSAGPGTGQWEMPFSGPAGGDAVPWLPAHAPASDAAWSGLVDDPEGPPPGPAAAGHDAGAADDGPYPVPSFDEPATAEGSAGPAGFDDAAAHAGPGRSAEPGPPDDPHAQDDTADRPDGGYDADADGYDADADGYDAYETGAHDDADPDAGGEPEHALAEGESGERTGDGAAPDDSGGDDLAGQDPDAAEPLPPVEETRSEHPLASYMLRVNGTDRPVTDAWLGESLLYVLRERLGLAGAKDGCEQGECGACSVQVDGRLVASCLVPAATAAGSEVRTVEGLTVDGRPSDVQCALAESGAVQCGFCIPGMAMTVHDLLEGNHKPTDLDIRQALSGNLCRCSGYRGVIDAVRAVVAGRDTDDPPAAGPDDPARVPHQGGPATSGGAQ